VEKTLHIIIVGAGIGGLTAALALLRAGHDVDVYEQAQELAELGAGVQVSANGARVLFALGLEDAIRNVWCEAAGKEIRLWNTGETWKLFDLGAESVARYGAPYFMIHRADLHRILIDAVRARKPDAIHLGSRCVGLEDDGTGVTLRLANDERVSGNALVGADGVHSRIRNILVGDDKAQFTGCMAWRGLVPIEKLPPHMRRNVGVNWVGPGGHVINYLLRRGEIFNFVGIIERDWRVESWTERGSREECAADFRGWNDDIHTIIRNIAEPYKWALLGRDPLTRFSHGRVTLLGDAAHPTLPMLAQGANGDRGRYGAGALPERARRCRDGAYVLRHRARRTHSQTGTRRERHGEAFPQSRTCGCQWRKGLCCGAVERDDREAALRLDLRI
jgi:salicylate hydroxylase